MEQEIFYFEQFNGYRILYFISSFNHLETNAATYWLSYANYVITYYRYYGGDIYGTRKILFWTIQGSG